MYSNKEVSIEKINAVCVALERKHVLTYLMSDNVKLIETVKQNAILLNACGDIGTAVKELEYKLIENTNLHLNKTEKIVMKGLKVASLKQSIELLSKNTTGINVAEILVSVLENLKELNFQIESCQHNID